MSSSRSAPGAPPGEDHAWRSGVLDHTARNRRRNAIIQPRRIVWGRFFSRASHPRGGTSATRPPRQSPLVEAANPLPHRVVQCWSSEQTRGYDDRHLCAVHRVAGPTEPLRILRPDLRRGPVPLALDNDSPPVRCGRQHVGTQIASASDSAGVEATITPTEIGNRVLELARVHGVIASNLHRLGRSDLRLVTFPQAPLFSTAGAPDYESAGPCAHQHKHHDAYERTIGKQVDKDDEADNASNGCGDNSPCERTSMCWCRHAPPLNNVCAQRS